MPKRLGLSIFGVLTIRGYFGQGRWHWREILATSDLTVKRLNYSDANGGSGLKLPLPLPQGRWPCCGRAHFCGYAKTATCGHKLLWWTLRGAHPKWWVEIPPWWKMWVCQRALVVVSENLCQLCHMMFLFLWFSWLVSCASQHCHGRCEGQQS